MSSVITLVPDFRRLADELYQLAKQECVGRSGVEPIRLRLPFQEILEQQSRGLAVA
ncbi:MAG: hypothetical protein KGM93_17120 [Sphingomonadales bacterium]|nr:hypothetical protein [Sphingomonadales bacterium]